MIVEVIHATYIEASAIDAINGVSDQMKYPAAERQFFRDFAL